MRKAIKKRLIGYPLFFGSLYLASCIGLAAYYLHPLRKISKTPSGLNDVTITAQAGPDPAWATPSLAQGKPQGNVVFVMAHGYGGSRAAWRGVIENLQKAGYEAVDPAMPGQDASPDSTVGFGGKESQVLIDTVQWVRSRYPDKKPKIILLGVSMGGAACWLASERIPDQVDAVITEGAYARFDNTVDHWFDLVIPNGHFFLHPVESIAGWMSGIEPSKIRPVDAAAKWKKPALIIQGGLDILIAKSNADQLSQAAHCPLWQVPLAVHARCYATDSRGYMSHILAIAAPLATSRN